MEKDMTPILLEDLGMRYPTGNSNQKKRYGIYQCQYCGKEFEAMVADVKSSSTKSCGCQSKKYRNPHRLIGHSLYGTWKMMKSRCYNPNAINYKDYGGRGIKVCDRWLDINNFIEDMYPTWEEGLSLDRIDGDKGYDLNNCRWVSRDIQARNTRDIQANNTSGFRGVCWHKVANKWMAGIVVKNKQVYLGLFHTALGAAKAYETYVRLNNLEHNFTPALTEEEVEELNKQKEGL